MAHDPKKLAYWAEHESRWQGSGLSQRNYCQREGLSHSSFDRWRRLMRIATDTTAVPTARPVTLPEKLTLVPVQLSGDPGIDGEIVLRSPAGWQVTLPSPLTGEALIALLSRLP